jgi:hypothetical protein
MQVVSSKLFLKVSKDSHGRFETNDEKLLNEINDMAECCERVVDSKPVKR